MMRGSLDKPELIVGKAKEKNRRSTEENRRSTPNDRMRRVKQTRSRKERSQKARMVDRLQNVFRTRAIGAEPPPARPFNVELERHVFIRIRSGHRMRLVELLGLRLTISVSVLSNRSWRNTFADAL